MISPFHSEPNSPYLTYTYTSKKTSSEEDNTSVASKRTYTSLSSAQHTLASSYTRINQLKPKSKIVFPKNVVFTQTQRITKNETKQPIPEVMLDLTPGRKTQSVISESIEYRNIKPLFSWNRMHLFCGFERAPMGADGCQCSDPCPWQLKWTRKRGIKDSIYYRRLLKQKLAEQDYLQIQKDLDRTFPDCPSFSNNKEFKKMLKNVLICYALHDKQSGYVQGMNMIAGVLLYHIKNPEATFWALVDIMYEKHLRMIYLNEFKHLHNHCNSIMHHISNKLNDLHQHMIDLDIIPASFLNGWLLSLMSTSIPMEHMHLVVDNFKKQSWMFMYKLIITFLLFLKERLLTTQDQSQFLLLVSVKGCQEVGKQWEQVIESSYKLIL